jgi:CheY-like chemotaxis protein
MDIQTRHDIFEPEDKTALVCVDEAEVQRAVVEQLGDLGYRIHTGLFAEDISLKLRAHTYNVVAIYETFAGSVAEGNPVLLETTRTLPVQRRNQFVVLIGPNMITNDEIQAFQFSVDLVFSVSDLANFKPVLRRGVARHTEFYRRFNECLRMAGA